MKQRGIKECGPACVQMILKYYHGYVSIDNLSEMMNTNQNGTTAYNIKETLKDLGFNSYGLQTNNISELKLPCIVHLIIGSYKHYVVVYKINQKKETLLIADPATNIKQMSFKEFKQLWSGISIQMYPISKIVCQSKPKIFKFIWYYIKKHFKLMFIIYLLSIIDSFLSLITSLFFPIILSNLNNKYLNYIFYFFIFAFLLKNIIFYFKNKLLIKLNLDLDKELSLDIFKNILNLPYRYYRRKTTGEITNYFNDLYIIRNAISKFSQIALIEIPLIIIILCIFLNINKIILMIIIVSISLLLLFQTIYQKKQNLWISEAIRHKATLNSYIVECISGFESIKNLNIIHKIYYKFQEKYKKLINIQKRLYNYEEKSFLVKEMIYNLSLLLITIAIIKVSNGNFKHFVIIFVLSSLFISSFKNLLNYNYQLSEVMSALSNITELTLKKSENKKLIQANGDIVIKNLNYTFDKYSYILKNINIKIPKATKVIIAGSSGSGKSTLLKIIKGYYKDYSGSVKIGGLEIKENNFNNIIYISQKETLFTGTLEENLKLKGDNPQNNRICEIESFAKNDYYQLIEEDGFNLSGGQKQRIVLARALNDFQILIIDEGLNQVSVDMERRILKNIFKAYSKKTIIYISHRLDNLDLFDQYIQIQNGEVVTSTKRNN